MPPLKRRVARAARAASAHRPVRSPRPAGRALRWLLLAALGSPVDASAAQPQNPCAIAGHVTGPDGPVAGALLRASATSRQEAPGAPVSSPPSRGETFSARSAADGRYCLQVPAGREYLLEVDAEGFVGRSLLMPVSAAGRVVELELSPAAPRAPVQLETVVAHAPRRVPPSTRRGAAPGSDVASRSGASAGLFAGAAGDLAASAGVSGQFVPVAGGDLSIEGQAPSGNRVTLDGAGFEARDVPAEGLAAAGVFSHPYDVSRGQFTGGEIAGRTMGGTNVWGGAMRFAVEPSWRDAGELGNDRGAAQPRHVLLSGGGGGPLLPGRLFVYGAAQAHQRLSEPVSLDLGQPGSRIPADSLARFHQILERLGLGTPEGGGQGRTRTASTIARLDYVPNGAHALMLRLDARGMESSSDPATPFGGAAGAHVESFGGGAFAQLTSRLARAENELSVRGSLAGQRARGHAAGPAGQVWIASGDTSEAVSGGTLAFGGASPGLPAEDRTVLEVADRLVVTSRGGTHQLQLGGAWQSEQVWRASRADRFGTFTFASLADLEAGRPVRFTRSLGDRSAELASGYAAAYAGHLWKPSPGLRVVIGLRGERYSFSGPDRSDPPADSVFGMRRVPGDSRWRASPRAGFTSYHSVGASTFSVQGGTGLFRGAAPTRLLAALLAGDGGGEAVNLVCVGSGIPAPRWADYARDEGAIPSGCAGTEGDAAAPRIEVTGFARDYAAPRVWHSSLGATWLHRPSAIGLEVRLGYSRGGAMALAADRNLAAHTHFLLEAEEGRPVYVPVSAIDARSGQVTAERSRADARFGVVREVNARGASSASTLSVVAHRLSGGGLVELYYTLTRSRDQSTGVAGPGGGWATTAGDPRTAEWASSDFEQRHAIQLSAVRQLRRWGSATVVWRLLSGTPFTPVVDADINGDGLVNDRAFVFDPATAPDPRLRADLEALLEQLPAPARACLHRQAGRIAARNSCRTPWNSFLDLQLNVFPGGPRNKRVVLNVAAENVTSALDYVLHGRGDLHGWGQYPSTDPVLLRAVRFDASRREFGYEVNPGFGPDAGRWGSIPFSLRLQARVTLGADPGTQALVAQVVANQDRLEPDTLLAEMLRRWGNVPGAVLERDLTHPLGLTPEQTAALRASADTVRTESARIAAELARGVTDLGSSDGTQVQSALVRQRELLGRGQAVLEHGQAAVRSVLTPRQWGQLPGRIRAAPRATMPISPMGGVQLLPDF